MGPRPDEGFQPETEFFLECTKDKAEERIQVAKEAANTGEGEQILDAIGSRLCRFIKTEDNINPSSLSVWGKYQIQRCLVILVIIWLPTSFHLLNMVFYRAETDYWCKR